MPACKTQAAIGTEHLVRWESLWRRKTAKASICWCSSALSVGPAAATAPAATTDTSGSGEGKANPASKFQGAEKRRSPRYKCESSAEIREDDRDVRTWATFSDISLHGC